MITKVHGLSLELEVLLGLRDQVLKLGVPLVGRVIESLLLLTINALRASKREPDLSVISLHSEDLQQHS